jgi:hypothetical protein
VFRRQIADIEAGPDPDREVPPDRPIDRGHVFDQCEIVERINARAAKIREQQHPVDVMAQEALRQGGRQMPEPVAL